MRNPRIIRRRHVLGRVGVLAIIFAAPVSTLASPRSDPMAAGFADPPATARPRVWWHWMNGNVTKEGIRLDLEWMHRAGLGGVQNFDAALATPQIVEQRLPYMSPQWRDAFRYAANLSEQLGLELAIASSPGWSATGGPWVTPQDAMKKLVWSEIRLVGGRPFSGTLPKPPSTTGAFQDAGPTPGMMGNMPTHTLPEYYADSAVVAYRVRKQQVMPVGAASTNAGAVEATLLTDGSLRQALQVPAGNDSWLEISYQRPVTIRSATLAYGTGRLSAKLQASSNGIDFRDVASFPTVGAPQRTISFEPVTARTFRVRFVPLPPAAPPPMLVGAPGAIVFDITGASTPAPTSIAVSEFRLSGEARVDQFEAKSGFATVPNYYAIQTPETSGAEPVSAGDVIDLTSRMQPDGTLEWTPPRGNWRVLRLGYSLIGTENHPATAEATGLEVDKYDRAAVRRYMEAYLSTYKSALGNDLIGARGVRAFLNDSIEVGPQNWTTDLLLQFRTRRGYDPVPWLPVLTGVIVESASRSDAFLYDFRRTLADLLADNHYGEVARVAHEHGLTTYGEALEVYRPMIGDDMDMRRFADIPMAAMWTYPSGVQPFPAHYADIRGAASVSHIYGREFVAAESLTSGFSPWAFSPRDLKPIIDLEFALGVNRPVIHTSVHQPVIDRKPGLSLMVFGQYFNRNETWAEQARPWVDYIARSAWLLQQGRYVADVAWFIGEEAPLTAMYSDQLTPHLPTGYGFDFVNATALISEFKVDDGDLVTRSGMRYRILYLGGSSDRMTLSVLRKISQLVDAGAVIVGQRPTVSPSLADDPIEFAKLADRLWSGGSIQLTIAGRGRVIATTDIDLGLRSIGIAPDFTFTKPHADTELMALHRKLEAGDLYFVTNRKRREEAVELSFRVTGRQPELWHADSGARERVSFRVEGDRTIVPLTLQPDEAVFVVFRDAGAGESAVVNRATYSVVRTLDGPWDILFEPGRGAPAGARFDKLTGWDTNADPGIRYFSGTATYTQEIRLSRADLAEGTLALDLGNVRELAEVLVNGRAVGIVWHPPYRVNISDALRPGANRIAIKVTNLWVNRLIGDAQPGAQPQYTFTALPTYSPGAPLKPSGLLGPVALVRADGGARRPE